MIFYRSIILACMFFVLYPLSAKNLNLPKSNAIFQKSSAIDPLRTLSNIGNISYWLHYDGKSGVDPDGNTGTIYPRGTAGVVYQDGLIWGAKVNGEILVGGQTYPTGTQALLDHIYRIRRDWALLTSSAASIQQDAAEFYNIDQSLVTMEQTTEIIAQYKKDWLEWPVDRGAPYVDIDLNGSYNPVLDSNSMPDASRGDYPGIKDADQVVWFVANDQDAGKTTTLYGSEPMGIEMQVTVWAYNRPDSRLGQAIYKKYTLKNISTDIFEEMYLSQWSDTDIGNYRDDLVGCDVLRNTAFAYNGTPHDTDYDQYQLPPAAFGYTLLQGPIVPSPGDSAYFDSHKIADFMNLKMTSFGYFDSGNSVWHDPTLMKYDGTLEWYNLMRGYLPNTNVDSPTPFTHRASGVATKFPLDGDPVAGTGDIDGQGVNHVAGARQMNFSTGPFNLQPGETQEMVLALVGGLGDTYLSSVSELKANVDFIQKSYGKPLKVPKVNYTITKIDPSETSMFLQADLKDFGKVDSCRITLHSLLGSDLHFSIILYDDGTHADKVAGDNIWANNWTGLNRKYPHSADLIINSSNQKDEFTNFISNIRLRPLPRFQNWQVIWENGKQDKKLNQNEKVHLKFDMTYQDTQNKIDTLTVEKQRKFVFYSGLENGQIIQNDSLYFLLTGSVTGDTLSFSFFVNYDHNTAVVMATIPVSVLQENPGWQDTLAVKVIKGTDRNVLALIADPLQLTGHLYSIAFHEDSTSGHLYWSLWDETTHELKLKRAETNNNPDFAYPVVDGILFRVKWSPSSGINPHDPWYASDGRWISGTNWGGRYFYGGLDSRWDYFGPTFINPNVYRDVEMFWAADTTDNAQSVSEADLIATSKRQFPDRWSKGQSYRRDLGYSAAGMGDIPFAVYDMEVDPPRRLNICFVEDATAGSANLIWDMGWNNGAFADLGGREYLFIMNSDYNEGVDYDDLNFGPSADVMYALWPAQRYRFYLSSPFTFGINASHPNVDGDSLTVDGQEAIHDVEKHVPADVYLRQNYPNPFNPTTHIRFGLVRNVKLKLEVFNLLGQKVRTLINKNMNAGSYNIQWNGRNDAGHVLSSGIYIYRIKAAEFVQSKKMLLLK